MNLTQLLEAITYSENSATVEVTEDWLQGRSMFGGLQAALGVRAMRQAIPEDLPLKTLQTTFISPVPSGKVTATASILRTGKNATHVEARIVDGEQTLALFVGVFGRSRDSAIGREIPQPIIDNPTNTLFEFLKGVTPNFTQHFTAKWLKGGLPFTSSQLPESVTEISINEDALTSESHFLAIADFIPPVALSLLTVPSAGSSLTWMLEFLCDDYQRQPLQKWRVDAEMTAASGGYTSQTATIYAPDGSAVALSRQSMVIFG